MVTFHPEAVYRVSKRGLVLGGAAGESALFEHPKAALLPAFINDDPSEQELLDWLGPPLSPGLVGDLISMAVLSDAATGRTPAPVAAPQGMLEFTRSGLMIPGIQRPSAWLNTYALPALISVPGRVILAAIVVAGVAAIVVGRPDLPAVSSNPTLEALLTILLGLIAVVLHESAHAVALTHFGRTPRRAGFGFYWGALSYFVDSTPALTLGKRERVIQALAGLAVDAVTTSLCAIAAHLVDNTLWAIVFWRLAILGTFDIAFNLLPVLQVDGHWALADLLDEPDLAPRARRALGAAFRRGHPATDHALAAYGALSLIFGIALITASALVFWSVAGDLVLSLFNGNIGDTLLALYYIVPIGLGLIFSTLGLILETILTTNEKADGQPADHPSITPDP